MDGWMDGWMDAGRKDGWIDGWMDGCQSVTLAVVRSLNLASNSLIF